MRFLIVSLLLLSGCAGFTPGPEANFWTQCLKISGYGFTMGTAYGPFNLGVLTYERNVECKSDITPPNVIMPGTIKGL